VLACIPDPLVINLTRWCIPDPLVSLASVLACIPDPLVIKIPGGAMTCCDLGCFARRPHEL